MDTTKTSNPLLTSKHLFYMQISVYIGAFLSHFTSNIVNVALPKLTETFQEPISLIQWITIGYILTISVTLPVMGEIADRVGYRLLHNMGFIVFTISSILVAIAPNLTFLLIFRVFQAIGTAMFQSTNMALIILHTPKPKRGQALGMISTFVALGGMFGPVVGGWMIEWLNWHWLFLVHVPFTVLAIILSTKFIPKSQLVRRKDSIDGIGLSLFICMIGSLIFGIANGSQWGWFSNQIGLFILITGLALILLILWELKQKHSFLPFHLFQNPLISTCLLTILVTFIVANATIVSIPFYVSKTFHLPADLIGYLMITYPVILSIMGPIAGKLSDQYGSKRFILMGLTSMLGNSLTIFILQGQLSIYQILFILVLSGIGMGCVASPTNRLVMELIPSSFIGVIGGLLALLRNLGTLMGASLSLALISGTTSISFSLSLTQTFIICMILVVICLISFVCSHVFVK